MGCDINISKRKMPSKSKIFDYWKTKIPQVICPQCQAIEEKMKYCVACLGSGSLDHCGLLGNKGFAKFDSPLDMEEACFACGIIGNNGWQDLERAHILPRCSGGSDEPENIHLLCDICHVLSEYLHGAGYWKWFNGRMFYQRLCEARVGKYIIFDHVTKTYITGVQNENMYMNK